MDDVPATQPDVLPPVTLSDRATRIRALSATTQSLILEIGRELIAAQGEFSSRAVFDAWIEAEFAWSVRTAWRFMAVTRAFGGHEAVELDDLSIDMGALIKLARPSVTPAQREFVVDVARETGARIDMAEAERLVQVAIAAERARLETELYKGAEGRNEAVKAEVERILAKAASRNPEAEERAKEAQRCIKAIQTLISMPPPDLVAASLNPTQRLTALEFCEPLSEWLGSLAKSIEQDE